jgi:hypothetical protein
MARLASLSLSQFVSCPLVVLALVAGAKVASAQEVAPSAISLTGPSPAPAAPATVRAAPAAAPAAPDVPPAKEAPPEYNGNDHDLFVHHIAVGYFGVSQLPVGQNGAAPGIVNAPVVGVRYWASRLVGVDLGLGFGYSTTSETGVAASTDTWGFALHAGLPLSLAQSRHFSFEVVPIEATLGFAGGSNPGGAPGAPSASGLLFRAGARVGAELQFGFIGIPQLALEASLGLYVQHESFGVGNVSVNQTTFTTSVSSDPWAIFTDTVSALYYF